MRYQEPSREDLLEQLEEVTERHEEEYLQLEGVFQARAVAAILTATDVPELVEARALAYRALARLSNEGE